MKGLWDSFRGAGEKGKHAFKRQRASASSISLLLTRFSFFAGDGQSNSPARVPRPCSGFSCFLPPPQPRSTGQTCYISLSNKKTSLAHNTRRSHHGENSQETGRERRVRCSRLSSRIERVIEQANSRLAIGSVSHSFCRYALSYISMSSMHCSQGSLSRTKISVCPRFPVAELYSAYKT